MSYKVGFRITAMSALVLLAACQSTSSSSGGKWKNIGQSVNQNIKHELDTTSVQKNGNTVTFRDRKTVKNPQLETTPNLPVFKTAIKTYQMQCREKTYRIIATELRNAQDVVVYQQSFGSQVPMQRITQGSPAQKQFESVCS